MLRNVLDGALLQPQERDGRRFVAVARALANFPVALLSSEPST
jgi:hypothetical protein